jgi:cytochrome c1
MKRAAIIALLFAAACTRERPAPPAAPAGDTHRGKEAILKYGCTACHNIPGVDGPKGMVGPPLDHWKSRTFIAGKYPNTTETMVKWLQNPQALDPSNAMPNLGVTPADAKDIAAYLYTLN